MPSQRSVVMGFVLSLVLALGGCMTPAARYNAIAAEYGLGADVVDGAGFRHRIWYGASHASWREATGGPERVRIYIEGDGSPWLQGHNIAADPTPRRPMALAMLARDSGVAVLLGRPCYHGFARDAGCEPSLWTDARYGNAVLESLQAALGSVLACCRSARITLVGYSGGGALARLLASRVPRVDRILTLAANLDIVAWARLRDYRPLEGSLNPLDAQPFGGEEIHLVGAKDRDVPPAIVESYAARHPRAHVERFPAFDHRCCWVESWPSLLTRFDS